MGKRKGISIELEINQQTLDKVLALWNCFSEIMELNTSQIEGIVYSITKTKMQYLIAERITHNKQGLSLVDAGKIVPIIEDKLGVAVNYCIVHIPEKGWMYRRVDIDPHNNTNSKINNSNNDYIKDLTDTEIQFRIERINPNKTVMSIRSTKFDNT